MIILGLPGKGLQGSVGIEGLLCGGPSRNKSTNNRAVLLGSAGLWQRLGKPSGLRRRTVRSLASFHFVYIISLQIRGKVGRVPAPVQGYFERSPDISEY